MGRPSGVAARTPVRATRSAFPTRARIEPLAERPQPLGDRRIDRAVGSPQLHGRPHMHAAGGGRDIAAGAAQHRSARLPIRQGLMQDVTLDRRQARQLSGRGLPCRRRRWRAPPASAAIVRAGVETRRAAPGRTPLTADVTQSADLHLGAGRGMAQGRQGQQRIEAPVLRGVNSSAAGEFRRQAGQEVVRHVGRHRFGLGADGVEAGRKIARGAALQGRTAGRPQTRARLPRRLRRRGRRATAAAKAGQRVARLAISRAKSPASTAVQHRLERPVAASMPAATPEGALSPKAPPPWATLA